MTLLVLLSLTVTVSAYDKSINTPIYRVYNPASGEHLYTTAFGEALSLRDQHGWTIEGCPWYSPVHQTNVYRLYNPTIGEHLYTTDINEVNYLTSFMSGWLVDNNGYPSFWSGGSLPVYRLYSPSSGRHLLTSDENEYNVLPQHGWVQEGVALYGVPEKDLV